MSFRDFSRREDDDDFEHGIPDTAPTAGALFDAQLSVERIDRALAELAPMYREVILLHYREALTLDEAARILKVPLNTLKSRDRRALIMLKKLLEPQEDR